MKSGLVEDILLGKFLGGKAKRKRGEERVAGESPREM
jgi:hypothetical protein